MIYYTHTEQNNIKSSAERSDTVSEQEKKVVEKLKEAIPKMNDFQKGYVLGMVEGSASVSKISQ